MWETDVWTVLHRADGRELHTIRLATILDTPALERLADMAGPFATRAVLYNPRTERVIY